MDNRIISKGSDRPVKLSPAESEYGDEWVAFIGVGPQQPWGYKGLTKDELIEIRDWINGRLVELEPVDDEDELDWTPPSEKNLDDVCSCGSKMCKVTRRDCITDSHDDWQQTFVEKDGTQTFYRNGEVVTADDFF